MDFVLSKLLWAILAPGNLLLLLLVAGLAWRRVLYVVVPLLVVLAVFPVGAWLAMPLENRYPSPMPPPEQVDGIVVLGGAIDGPLSAARGQPVLSEAAERLTAAVALARRYPGARIVFSGGEGALLPQGHAEADAAVAFFAEAGVPRRRLAIENRARNTWENAVYSQALAQPKPGETWLLVTSAWHMPRALGCFRKLGWDVLPWPVDYRTGPERIVLGFALGEQLAALNLVTKEWAGLAAYWAMGRI
jgi:uncharacterized SAM-binding protein YcdF (DUF218 family)